MKTLYEGILADMEDVMTRSDSDIREAVKSFLFDNYYGSYIIPMKPNKDGIFEITFTKKMVVINKELSELTNGLFIFGDCKGEFDCSHCINLTSLKGSPRSIGTFNCSYCPKLTSLVGGPEKLYNNTTYYCNDCGLTTLKGSPKNCFGMNCCNNKIKNLVGGPEKINGHFICNHNSELESLKGCPEQIKGWFDCSNCPKLELESLKMYFPKKLEADFICINNFKDKTQEEKNEMKEYLCNKIGYDTELILM